MPQGANQKGRLMAGARDIRAGRAYVELSTKDKMTRGLARAQARLQAFGAVCQRMGRSLFAVGGGVLAALGAASKVFADFEKQMAMVSTMLDRPVAHMARFKEAVRDMAVSSGQSTETIAKGLYDILSASIAPEKALGFLRVALRAAEGGMTDVATATKGMIRILRAYDMDAAQAADISDTLFTVVKKGVITYEELAEHIGSVAPSARAAGLTLQQLAAAVATVVSVEEPTRAMTALRQAIFEAAEEGTDLLSFVREFKGADLAKVIAAGIPKRAAQGVVILASNLALLDENLAAMAARAGAGEEAYRKMASTLTKAFNQAKQAVVVAAGRIGEALAPVLKDWLSGAKDAIESWATWIRQNHELVAEYARAALKIAAWTVGLGAALIVVGKLVGASPLAVAIGAVGLLGYGLYRLSGYSVEAIANLTAYRDAQDKARAADLARLRQLDELTKTERLNTQEMAEAKRLITELSDRYGDLGVRLDETTGRLENVYEATRKVHDEMRKRRANELILEISKLHNKIQQLRETFTGGAAKKIFNWATGAMENAGDRIVRLQRKLTRTVAELQAVRAGVGAEGLTGGIKVPAVVKPAGKPAVTAGPEQPPAWSRETMELRTGLRMEAEARGKADALRLAALDEEKHLRYEIARAELEATKEGADLRLALLALERRQALAQAPEGVDVALVKRLYDARRQAILAGADASRSAASSAASGPSGSGAATRPNAWRLASTRLRRTLNPCAKRERWSSADSCFAAKRCFAE